MIADVADQPVKAAIAQGKSIDIDHGIDQTGLTEQGCQCARFDSRVGSGCEGTFPTVGGMERGTQGRKALPSRQRTCQQSARRQARCNDAKQKRQLIASIQLAHDQDEVEGGFLFLRKGVDRLGEAHLLTDTSELRMESGRRSGDQHLSEAALDRGQALDPLPDDALGKEGAGLAAKRTKASPLARRVIEQRFGHAPLWDRPT
jgi:hypothetical protein